MRIQLNCCVHLVDNLLPHTPQISGDSSCLPLHRDRTNKNICWKSNRIKPLLGNRKPFKLEPVSRFRRYQSRPDGLRIRPRLGDGYGWSVCAHQGKRERFQTDGRDICLQYMGTVTISHNEGLYVKSNSMK